MATAQWPARALGMLSSRVSINTVSQHMVSTEKHMAQKLTPLKYNLLKSFYSII